MPELAEVEFFRRRWAVGQGDRVVAVQVHRHARIFRGCDVDALSRALTGAVLRTSQAAAKQMLFEFRTARAPRSAWLGIHLGMSGELRSEAVGYASNRHDHLVLQQQKRVLVFEDPRMFGAVQFATGDQKPEWWTSIAPAIVSSAFTRKAVADFLNRRRRAPIKAVLLMQERFPGVGNWMADEILWRAAIHPAQSAGSLTDDEISRLHRECRWVCRAALRLNGGVGHRLPLQLNAFIPRTWLFWHRWEPGGKCPRTHRPLARATIGGRTTCWSPARQKRHRA
ncbi:MAG TPA: DNA-formamidopyrimidine glycosylase family protein [Candidatus Didemnitutus sp.]|nr:DNA-formamidopyrimidine glycosylase family protein [Candidatus Didemnitutus sp.]